MAARRGALCAATGAALLLLAALAGCRLANTDSRWSEAVWGWAQLAEAQATAWWAAHSPAAVATLPPPQPPAALRAAAGLPRQPAQPLTVMLQLPDHRELQLREDETLESLVAKLLQEQAGLHPTAIELVSIEQVTQQRTSPFRAVLRAVAALREPSAGDAAAPQGAGADVAALTADPALQQLAAGGSAAVHLLSDVGSAAGGKHATQLGSKHNHHALRNGRKLRQQIHLASQQPEHAYVKLFGPPRSIDTPAQPAGAQQAAAAAADVQQPIVIVELTLVGQESGMQQPLLPLLGGFSSRLGGNAAEAVEAAAGEAAEGSSWGEAAHWANMEEYLQSLLPPGQHTQHTWQPSQRRHRHSHAHGASHRRHSWVEEGVVLPARPPPSPLKLAVLDTVFITAVVVALVCSSLLVADIMRHGLWPEQHHEQHGSAASHCGGHPAGAMVAVGQPEQQPLLIVVAADEVAAAQQAGYNKL